MILIQLINEYFVILGISEQQRRDSNKFNARILTTFSVFGFCILSNIAYLWLEVNNSVEFVECLYIASSAFGNALALTIIIWKLGKLLKFFGDFENIIQERQKNPKSKNIYDQTNRQIEKWNKFTNIGTILVPISCNLPKTVNSYFKYVTTELGSEAFQLTFPTWFPFDTKNPFGYFWAALLESITTFYISFLTICIIFIGIGAHLIVISIAKDLKADLNCINKSSHNKKTRLHILKQINGFSQVHAIAKQLLHNFSIIFQYIFMDVFMWCTFGICGALLMIQMELTHSKDYSAFLVILLFELFWSLALLLTSCDLCEKTTTAYNEINYEIDQLDWYLFPYEVKKMLPMIMINAQKQVKFECFGSTISSDRETFKKVTNRAFSFFMMLRQFIK